MRFRHATRAGTYHRIADPHWTDPLSGEFAKARGGRWNAAGSFAVVYLNRTRDTARANVRRRFTGQPFSPDDLIPERRPVLIETTVPQAVCVDVITDEGCHAAGLPQTYPLDLDGSDVTHERCMEVGHAAFDAGEPGIACRSAATPTPPYGEELAWFERDERLVPVRRLSFDEWYHRHLPQS